MTPVPIRIPAKGETPLSLAEQRIAQELGIKPKRRYAQRFWWREPQQPKAMPPMEPCL